MKHFRKLNRKILQLLPERFRIEAMRKNIRLRHDWPSPSLEIKIADTQQELDEAFRLLHDSYVKANYMQPDPSGLRILPQHLLSQTATLIAKWDGKVVGTLSLIRDNPMGLPMEKIFSVGDRRKKGRRLAEVSSLAVDPRFRGLVNQVLFPLFRFAIQYARELFGIHEFVAATTPELSQVYVSFLCFERLTFKSLAYDFANGTDAVALYLDFDSANERWREAYDHRPVAKNFYKYWTERPTDSRNQMPQRAYHSAIDPVLTPQLLESFFLKRAEMARRLTYKDVQILLESYPFPAFQKVLLPLQAELMRKSVRLETQMKAEVGPERTPAEVLNISKNGLLLRLNSDRQMQMDTTSIEIWLNETVRTRLQIEVRGHPTESLFGYQILEPTTEWLQMFDTLERDYKKMAQALVSVA